MKMVTGAVCWSLSDSDFAFESGKQILGPYGKMINVDFLVNGPASESLVLTVGTTNAAAAHPLANEVLRKWFDLHKVAKDKKHLAL